MCSLGGSRRVTQAVVHGLRIPRAGIELATHGAAVLRTVPAAVHKHLVATTSMTSVLVSSCALLAWQALGEGQVHVCGLEQVVIDLVEVVDGADEVGANVFPVVEGRETAVDAHVRVWLVFGVGIAGLLGIDPILDVNNARAVVDLVCDVGCLGVYGSHLSDDGNLADGVVVELEVGAWVGFLAVLDLLDGNGSKGVVGKL